MNITIPNPVVTAILEYCLTQESVRVVVGYSGLTFNKFGKSLTTDTQISIITHIEHIINFSKLEGNILLNGKELKEFRLKEFPLNSELSASVV